MLGPAARESQRESASYSPTASERASARKGRTATVASERASSGRVKTEEGKEWVPRQRTERL